MNPERNCHVDLGGRRVLTRSLLLVVASVTLAAGASTGPAATDVAEVLRAGGIGFTSSVAAEPPSAPALSQARAATQGAAVTIRVYGSNGDRYDASTQSAKSCADCALVACGPILVEFGAKADAAVESDARSAYRILHDHYGCE
jgi:hypothetical protein